MANTNYLKNEVENWIRAWLCNQFPGKAFSKRFLPLSSGGFHEFDAVSHDCKIIAGIKTSSYKTSGGNLPQGKFANLYQELYFLNLASAIQKLLILTNKELYDDFIKRSDGKIASGIEIRHCSLPDDILDSVGAVQKKASSEQKSR